MAVGEGKRVLGIRVQDGRGLPQEGIGAASREAGKEKRQWEGHSQQRA